jgi:predicted DNA-binding transcriptional regulator
MTDGADIYERLRKVEDLIRYGPPRTTRELAIEVGVAPRTMRKYLTFLQTCGQYRMALVQEGWCWYVFEVQKETAPH